MGTKELRTTIIAYINEADEGTLQMVKEVFENYIAKNIVAYTVNGNPLSKKEYIRSIKAADESIDNGEFTSIEDLEKEVRNW